ncbi:LacI family DNA-binding transcriptional regulator [Agrobacterium sp. ES01]|uniref:LacI family DNA-binding transcriptional regulator n=1 Tax=Agrobacterium sp. ES01 TaxID=3420714 RepID=UPI003D109A71
MKPTVHDIAAHAGVSLATVDRVLNDRPGVREVTRVKVEESISALGFVRDVNAANLAKSRSYSFVLILPTGNNSFMEALRAEAMEAAQRAKFERTSIRIVDVRAFDAKSLAAILDGLAEERPDGVALVAVESPVVAAAIDRLAEQGIACVTLVSDLLGSKRVHYAGIDNLAAGRTAASLLGRFLRDRRGSVAVLAGSMLVRDHRERLEGFSAVLNTEFPKLNILPILEGWDEPERAERMVSSALGEHRNILGLYSLGAGNRGLVRAISARSEGEHISVIVHELTNTTREALKSGVIDAVLNQDPGHEIRSAIRVLTAKADNLQIVAAQERIRLDIFLRDNLP